MWFKNLLIYQFTKPFTLTLDELSDKLAERPFVPCNSQDPSSRGWVAPIGDENSPLVHSANGYGMLCLQRQDKVLPAAVVNEFLDDKIADIRDREERIPGRKERAELKEQITFELLPRAFTRSSRLYAYLAPKEGLLVINASAYGRAEELMNLLRDSLGSLPVLPIKTAEEPSAAMTRWLLNGPTPNSFEIGGECELRDSRDESSVIRCKNQALDSEEIRNHLEAGMRVTRLALKWQGDIEFLVDDKLAIKRLRFGDLILDKISDIHTESAVEQFDADFAIMTGEFAQLIPALVDAFGGPADPTTT